MKKVFALFASAAIAVAMVACSSSSSVPSSSISSSSSQVSSAMAIPSSKVVTDADKKSIIGKDNKIMDIISRSEKTTKLLQQAYEEVEKGNGTALDLYDVAKKAKGNQELFYGELGKLSDKNNKKYISACEDYVINLQTVASSLMKYIDKGSIKYLSAAKDCLKDADSYALKVTAERDNAFVKQGFTDSEVKNILAKSASSTGSK